MKKKLTLAMAVILIAVIACTLLVGCVPNNPNDFFEKWEKASAKSVIDSEQEVYARGNIIFIKIIEDECERNIYYKVTSHEVKFYYGLKANGEEQFEWQKTIGVNDCKITADIVLEGVGVYLYRERLSEFNKIFDKDFTKSDGAYVANKGSKWEGVSIKLAAKQMTVKVEADSYKKEVVYKIGCDKLTIPKEALNTQVEFKG